jgi:hypothetical protein
VLLWSVREERRWAASHTCEPRTIAERRNWNLPPSAQLTVTREPAFDHAAAQASGLIANDGQSRCTVSLRAVEMRRRLADSAPGLARRAATQSAQIDNYREEQP